MILGGQQGLVLVALRDPSGDPPLLYTSPSPSSGKRCWAPGLIQGDVGDPGLRKRLQVLETPGLSRGAQSPSLKPREQTPAQLEEE